MYVYTADGIYFCISEVSSQHIEENVKWTSPPYTSCHVDISLCADNCLYKVDVVQVVKFLMKFV